MSEPITDIEQLTNEWLDDVLRRAGVLDEGFVVRFDVKQTRTLLISKVFHLAVTYSADVPADAPTRLFLKISSPTLQSHFSQKEVEFYHEVAPRVPELPLIRCYDAAFSSVSGAAHLLLDDMSETHTQTVPPLPPSLRDCELAIDCLAQLHAHFWEHPQLGTEIGKLTTEAEFNLLVQTIRTHLNGFINFLGDRLTDERRRYYERIVAGSMQPWRRMLKLEGLTLSHGDAHSWNFLYPRDQATGAALIFDWHLWHVDIPLKDLAFMIAFNWYPQRRALLEQKLLRRYHAALVAGGVERYSWEDCWRDYRFAVIRELFVPVWQWSSGMEPGIWWANLEKIWLAFADLRCAELLDE